MAEANLKWGPDTCLGRMQDVQAGNGVGIGIGIRIDERKGSERVQKIAEANPGACLGKMQRVIAAYTAGPASWHCPRKITPIHFNSAI